MRCSIQDGLWRDCCRELGVSQEFQWYLRRQLSRRGFPSGARRDEALWVALGRLAEELLEQAAAPVDRRGWRRVVDRAVYQAERELRSCGSAVIELDHLAERPRNP